MARLVYWTPNRATHVRGDFSTTRRATETDREMMFYLVIGLATILFILFVVFAAKTWHWLDIVAVALFFPSVITFAILTAATLKTRANWGSLYQQMQDQLADVRGEIEKLETGYTVDRLGQIVRGEHSLPESQQQLGRELYNRGRIWRNCFPSEFADGAVTVNTANWGNEQCTGATITTSANPLTDAETAFFNVESEFVRLAQAQDPGGDPAGEAEGAPPAGRPHGIEEQLILHAFLEVPLEELDALVNAALFAGLDTNLEGRKRICTVPTVYLGEWAVTATAADSITMSPTLPLTPQQLAVIDQQRGSWALLEMIPVDSHEDFSHEDLSDDQKQALFEKLPEAVVREYLKDLKPGNRDEDPPERLMVRVRFQKNYNQIDVDATDEAPLLPSNDFDPLGRAVPAWLRQGGEGDEKGRVSFETGDEALLDSQTAQQLIAEDICDEIERIYVRQLQDYEFFFHDVHRQRTLFEDENRTIQKDTRLLENATFKSDADIAYRQEELERLDEDLENFVYEQQQITQYRQAVDQRYSEILNALSGLYRTNRRLSNQLAAISQRIENAADQRADQALGNDSPTPN